MNKSLRVGMLINGYYPRIGGAERVLASLTPALKSMDLEIFVITRKHPGLDFYELIDGVPVYRMPIPGPKALASLNYSYAAIKLLGKLNLDLLHVHALTSTARTAILAKKIWEIPVIGTIHRSGELGDIHQLKQKPFGQLRLSYYMKQIDSFVVISRDIETELSGLGIPAQRRAFIPNGVDTSRFQPVSARRKFALRESLGIQDGPVVIFVGRLDPEKRVNYLVDIWPGVRKAHPNATLLILGSGSQEATLRESKMDGVRFEGSIDDVVPYLQVSDLFVLPSVAEGLSVAALEAQAAGLPVLLTDVGGARDMVSHGHNGWVIPPDDRNALQGALIRLLRDDNSMQRMGDVARDRVMRDFSLASVANQLRNLYYQQIMRTSSAETSQQLS